MANDHVREAMARLPAGVVVVSARAGSGYRGLTASSLVTISSHPPMLLVVVQRETATRAAIVESKAFNVSVLSRTQEFIADRFAGRAPAVDEAWSTLPHRLGSNGIPLLEGSAAWFECELTDIHGAADHDILVGAVSTATAGAGDPLVVWDRVFWTLR